MHAQHLVKNIGADPMRKRGLFAPLKELLAPYKLAGYQAIVAGNWDTTAKPL